MPRPGTIEEAPTSWTPGMLLQLAPDGGIGPSNGGAYPGNDEDMFLFEPQVFVLNVVDLPGNDQSADD